LSKINRATPQTLDKAINNALDDFSEDASFNIGVLRHYLKVNISDFIRNNLSSIMLKGNDAVGEAVKKFVAKL